MPLLKLSKCPPKICAFPYMQILSLKNYKQILNFNKRSVSGEVSQCSAIYFEGHQKNMMNLWVEKWIGGQIYDKASTAQ